MSPEPSSVNRRILFAVLYAALVIGIVLIASPAFARTDPSAANVIAGDQGSAIRPFLVSVPEEALADLRNSAMCRYEVAGAALLGVLHPSSAGGSGT